VKFVDEYRQEPEVGVLLAALRRVAVRPWTIMEICGGQTHTLLRSGIDRMLPDTVTVVHGPGCPVCVTPLEQIDRAIAIAERREVIFTSFGDMLRVPGSRTDLLSVKARGGDVRMVYSPLDAVKLAQKHPSIGDFRNTGLLGCIELVKNRDTKEPMAPWNAKPEEMAVMNKVAAKINELGMFTFVRWNWIFVAPPLCINKAGIDEGMEIISKAVSIADEACN